VDTMTKNKTARDFFGTLQNLYVFIETCTKRHALYTKNQTLRNKKDKDGKQREYFLKKLSDTRWACRADSIKAIHHTLKAVLDSTRWRISRTTKPRQILLQKLKDCSTTLILSLFWL
jgi:ribosomal protein L31